MELDSIKQMVEQASTTFYSTQDKEQRRTAEEWLNDFKKSVDAWYVADQILHSSRNEQVLFFAAQTIRSKIQSSFHELPSGSHESLRNSLMEHLDNLSKSNYTSVQTQIYIALSDLMMLMNAWENPLPEIIHRFTKPPDRMSSLIEFLTILPEEINNKRLKLGKNRRDFMRDMFANSANYIIEFLDANLKKIIEDSITSNDLSDCQNKLKSIYKCFSSWIEEKLVQPGLIANSQLFKTSFNLLSNPSTELDLHDAVTTCLINLLLCYPLNARVDDDYKNLLFPLKENIYGLANAYKNAERQSEIEKCSDLCLIFTELCNALSFHLINDPGSQLGDVNILSLLIMCGTHEEYEVFQKTFVFWFSISEEIYTNPNSERLCEHFRQYVYSLIDCICKHCRLNENHDSIPPSKSDDFGEFRLKASDLVSDIVFIVEANKCFEKMYSILQSNANWFEIEAALFVMCSFAKSVSQEDENCVTQVAQAILSLPEGVHVSVKCTGIRLVGELCEWLNKHPHFISNSLNFVCNGFTNPILCQVAANTMLNICTQCQQHMLNHLESLINMAVSIDNFEIPNDASIELLKGTVVILSNLPSNEMVGPLIKICNIQVEGLQKAATGNSHEKGNIKNSPAFWLDRLTAIFRTIKIRTIVNDTHPCQAVVEQSWPVISLVLNKYQKDTKTTESCCRALRFMLRSTEKYSQSILVDVVNTVVNLYRINHMSCFLYLGSILVDIYGIEVEFKTGVIEMMQIFTKEAFDFIIKNCTNVENLDELRKHPDTVDDFFRLSLRFMQRCPLEFIESPIFSPIMTLAVTTLNLDHRDANLSVTKFLSEFISISHKPQIKGLNETNMNLVNRVLDEIGYKMIENTINSTINMTTRDTKDGIADVLSEILSTNRKFIDASLINVLKTLRKSNQHGNEIVNEKQLMEVHRKIMQSDSSTEVINALCQLEQLYL